MISMEISVEFGLNTVSHRIKNRINAKNSLILDQKFILGVDHVTMTQDFKAKEASRLCHRFSNA